MRKSVAVGLAVALALSACSSNGGDEDLEQRVEELEQELAGATSTTIETTTTTTTTTTTPTTTTAPSTTTTFDIARATPEARQAAVVSLFEEQGYAETIATILQDGLLLESVDVVRYNPDENALEIAVTSEFRSDDHREDQAWEITRVMATWWDEENVFGAITLTTNFRLDVSGGLYPCNHLYMVRLASLDMSRAEWAKVCR